MTILSNISQQFERHIEQVQLWLAKQTPRERFLVIVTSLFVLLSVLGVVLWQAHAMANAQQKRLNQLKDLTVWMQTNAATLQTADTLGLTIQDKIQRAAQQQALSVSSQGSEQQVLIAVEHPNYVVLANFLTQLAQMGLSIEKMEIISSGNQLKLTANVR